MNNEPVGLAVNNIAVVLLFVCLILSFAHIL